MAERDAYLISEQGKAPDFAMEMGSVSTCHTDVLETRRAYADMG